MTPLRTAVIGCGHLGRFHARLLSSMEGVELIAVVDPHSAARESLAAEVGTRAVDDYRRIVTDVDCIVLAAPTCFHAAIATELLEHDLHLLVEKPLAACSQDADDLARLAQHRHLVLAVGHVERFNPAFVAAQSCVEQPLYIEATRAGGFTFRSLDVGVVMDLMIHDLELVLALVNSPVESVSAFGAPVVTPHEDFAEARVTFENGCVAELKASRTSPTAQRQMTIYGHNEHYFIDFGERTARQLQRSSGLQQGTVHVDAMPLDEVERLKPQVFQTLLPTTDLAVPETNPLRDELEDFLTSVRLGKAPRVDGFHAANAVRVAEQIIQQIQRSPAYRPHLRRAA